MVQQHSSLGNLLTSALLLIVFVAQTVFADLAPNEDEDEAKPSPDLKKPDESITTLEPPKAGNLGFIHAFVASFSVIIVSEIGDKTFFIAAIMSMVSSLLRLTAKTYTMSTNTALFILEISSSDCIRWCNFGTRLDDRPLSSLRHGVHPVHPTSRYPLGLSAPLCIVWIKNVTRRLEHVGI